MRVGIVRVSFMIFDANSLKAKRKVMQSVKDRLMSNFNVSVAEVGSNDKWQMGEIGIATVANETGFVNSVIEKVKNHMESNPMIRVIDAEVEIL